MKAFLLVVAMALTFFTIIAAATVHRLERAANWDSRQIDTSIRG